MKKSFSEFVFLLFSIPTVGLIILALIIKRGDDVLFINGNHNELFDLFFSFVTTLGEGFLFVPLIGYLLFVKFRLAILAALVCAGHSGMCAFVKRGLFSHVQRPIAVLDTKLLHFVPHMEVHGLYSFPSGHTATIFCLTLIMALISKKRISAIIFLLIALLVGYSRIYLLQHFLIDVAGGAVIGVSFTYVIWKILEQNTMPAWMNRSLISRTSRTGTGFLSGIQQRSEP